MKNLFALLFVFALLGSTTVAQVSFTDQVSRLDMQGFHSGVAMAITDVNGDLLDDIVRLQNGTELYIEYQHADGTFSSELIDNQALSESQWTMAVGDINNDGLAEIMVGDHFQQYIWLAEGSDGFKNTYNGSSLPGGFFSQGSNFADINNDGWLDAFHCNDDGESFIWSNDGSGNLALANDWIDMQTGSGGDANSGNYGSTWTDFDNDGDLDLYIARCRQGVDDPSDPRRINGLYENDGEGNYTENADAYGLAIGWQSWTAEFQDIDNDGDFDCFLTNHDYYSQLLENQDGQFVDITAETGINVEIIPIQAVMKDFDNNGFVDLLVSGTDGELYLNNGDKTFSKVDDFIDSRDLESFAVGDVNRDGYLDFYGGYAQIYTSPSSIDDALWINEGGENNFLAVSLIGTECNQDAIGSRIEIFGDFGTQVREVRAGESYGIVNSKTQHFGLGANETVSSIEVTWPNGTTDVYENIAGNQFITIIEGLCISPNISIVAEGETVLCSGETVTLSAPEGFNYEWSNGETTQNITVDAAGTYSVRASDDSGCWANSAAISIEMNPDETPSIMALDNNLVLCAGDAVTLSSSTANGYEWSNGETTQELVVTESGTYSVTIQGVCEAFTSEEIVVEIKDVVQEPAILTPDVTIDNWGTASLEAEGDVIRWYESADAIEMIFEGPIFETPELLVSTTYWVNNNVVDGAELESGGKLDFSGSGGVNGAQFNGVNIFNAYEPFTLLSIDVRTESSGDRTFQVLDSNQNLIVEKTVFVELGDHTVSLNLEIPEGEGMIFKCAEHPDMYRNDGGVSYPYPIGTVGEIVTSNYGDEWYYYYFNWQIQKEGLICASERLPVEVEVLATGIDDPANALISLYPNPAQDQITLRWDTSFEVKELKLKSILGSTIQNIAANSFINGQANLALGDLAAGVYLIELSDGTLTYSEKVVISH